jgi:hypothetical protein
MHKLLLLLTAALLAGPGCKTKDPFPQPPTPPSPLAQLPPETQTGQRTFGCLLNGQAWNQAGNPFAAPVLSAEVNRKRLGISCRRSFNGSSGNPVANQSMGFSIDSVTGPGTYLLDSGDKNVFRFSDYLTNCQYTTGNGLSATVQLVRFDPVARIVAGRFSFTLEKPGCGKVVVTDGRFDCPF